MGTHWSIAGAKLMKLGRLLPARQSVKAPQCHAHHTGSSRATTPFKNAFRGYTSAPFSLDSGAKKFELPSVMQINKCTSIDTMGDFCVQL